MITGSESEAQGKNVDVNELKKSETSFPPVKYQHTAGPGGDFNSSNKLSNTQDSYMQEVKEILEELDEKREGDKRMVDEFRAKMNEMVEAICQQIEQRLVKRYEETNTVVESKLEYLNEILGRVNGLEQELADFHGAVTVLFQESTK